MTTHINVAGTWKEIDAGECKVNVAGTWRTVDTIEINVAGTWKTVYNNAVVSISQIDQPLYAFGFMTDVTSALRLRSTGELDENVGVGYAQDGNWITPTSAAGAGYDVRMTVNSGTVTSGSTGTWLSLGTTREWSQSTVGAGLQTANVTVEIRNASTLTVLATLTFDFSAENGV